MRRKIVKSNKLTSKKFNKLKTALLSFLATRGIYFGKKIKRGCPGVGQEICKKVNTNNNFISSIPSMGQEELHKQKLNTRYGKLKKFPFIPLQEWGLKAFTLVELIVVIVILAILATIAFISLLGYVAEARDTQKIVELKNLQKVITLYEIEHGKLPSLDNHSESLDINGTTYNKGIFGETAFSEVKKLNKLPINPTTNTGYTYLVSKGGKKFILEAELEKEIDKNGTNKKFMVGNYKSNIADNTNGGEDTGNGNTGGGTNTNQDCTANTSYTYNGQTYDLPLLNHNANQTLTSEQVHTPANGKTIYSLEVSCNNGNINNGTETSNITCNENYYKDGENCKKKYASCKEIKTEIASSTDGTYDIFVNGTKLSVYCDMTTDGGGWTRYLNIKGNYSFENAKNCWLGNIINNENIECFNPNRFGMIATDFMAKQTKNSTSTTYKKAITTNTEASVNINMNYINYNCKGATNYMTIMGGKNDTILDDLSNIKIVRLGLNFCNEISKNRQLGGISIFNNRNDYMNYSWYGYFGPNPYVSGSESKSRETSVNPLEIYIRE